MSLAMHSRQYWCNLAATCLKYLLNVRLPAWRSVKIPISALPKGEKQDLWLDLQRVAEVRWLVTAQTLATSFWQCNATPRTAVCCLALHP